jgi:hypothetical protein
MFFEKALEVSYQITNEWVAVKRSNRYCEARKLTHLCITRQPWYVIDHHAARAAGSHPTGISNCDGVV